VPGFSRSAVPGFSRSVVSGFSRTKMDKELARLSDAESIAREQQRGARIFLNHRGTNELGASIELLALMDGAFDRGVSRFEPHHPSREGAVLSREGFRLR
jgi:hypothetical protein